MYQDYIEPSVKPVEHPFRKVPVLQKDRIKADLHRMEKLVLEKQTEPTAWVNSMVTVVKPNKLTIGIDPKDLNESTAPAHSARRRSWSAGCQSVFSKCWSQKTIQL